MCEPTTTQQQQQQQGRIQAALSITLALLPCVWLFLLGCFLFVAPSRILDLAFTCFRDEEGDDDVDNNNNTNNNNNTVPPSSSTSSLEIRMSRFVGCVLLGQVLSCLALFYPFLHHTCQQQQQQQQTRLSATEYASILDKFRSGTASLFILALLQIVGGLIDDRTRYNDDNDNGEPFCSTLQSTFVIATGASTLIFACGSLMVSFWPSSSSSMDHHRPTANHSPLPPRPGSSSSESPALLLLSSESCILRFFCWCCGCNYWGSAANNNHDNNRTGHNGDGDARVPLLLSEEEEENNNDNGDDARREEEEGEQQQQRGSSATSGGPNETFESDPDAFVITDPQNTTDDEEEAESSTSRIRGTTRLLKLAAPQVFYLYVGCAVLLIRLPFSLSIPHFVSTAIGAVAREDFAQARTEIVLLFLLGSIDAALDFWCVFLFGYANQRIVRGVRIDTFRSILRQEVAFFDETTSGELTSRLNSDCGEMAGDLTWFFRFSIESIVRITGIVSYMLIRSPILGSCALTIIPAVALANKFYGNWLTENARQVQDALAAANHVAQETFSCVRTVIAFASEHQEYEKYKEKIDHQYRLNVRQLYITGVYYMVISTFLINTVVQSILLAIGTALIQHGKLTAEVLLAFMLYQGQLQSETMNLFQSYTSLVKSSGAGDKVFSLLDRSPQPPGTGSANVVAEDEEPTEGNDAENTNGAANAAATDHNAQSQIACNVVLKDVSFYYPCRRDNVVLKDFNLQIPQGSTVALVGASGGGKSTVVGLLQRFYDPVSGCIFIDGQDLREINLKKHRRHIGIVGQNPVLFKGTILSNITYGCPTATREQAIEAARMANAHSFVTSFRNGYDTDVGERGVQLSGGQMQRIAIARAVIKKPRLLLLDEATSALDAESEQAVQDALDTLLKTNKDMTSVIVAHRLRTVRNADMIAFIEGGRVAERGTHEELLKLPDGHYRKMVEKAGTDGQLPDQ